ncbi:MFS general substrate transporter [Pleurostoma richardsiae]|uniref:MFS general substrate transporter n=1 Tax=Pleurostoma richardsiae TaxID=41990 RepID=A0AA38RK00_9PEZI|nr:MFS general substrate transporter [Pleurostoma richardsiae]
MFLLASLLCLLGTIICSAAETYHTLLAGRILEGAGFAAYESLSFTTVGDLFYVHERGLWTSVISFTLTAVSNLSSVIAGPITFELGWHYLFYILTASVGFQLLLAFLFVPETSYLRDPRFNQHLVVDAPSEAGTDNGSKEADVSNIENVDPEPVGASPPAKKTFWQELAVFTGSYSEESLLPLIFAPVLCWSNIYAFWTIIVTGTVTSFYVAISYIIAQLFSPPPYLLSTAEIGYMSLGPFVGGAVGTILLALWMDPISIWMAKRNQGVYEPEFRLVLVIFGLLCPAGLFGFGAVAQAKGNVYLVAFMWGLALAGIAFVVGPCSAYAIDAFRGMSNEIFVSNVMFKNFLFYGYSYFMNSWVADAGAAGPFYIFGGISAGLVATTIIAYMFGKRYRGYWNRNNLMEKMNIRTHPEW